MSRHFHNSEGYPDPTAGCVLYADTRKRKARFIIKVILFIVWEAGYRVVSHIDLEDRQTGRIY